MHLFHLASFDFFQLEKSWKTFLHDVLTLFKMQNLGKFIIDTGVSK